jgi:hypothetical protein
LTNQPLKSFFLLKIAIVFTSFGIIHIILFPDEFVSDEFFANFYTTFHHFLSIVLVVYHGDAMTKQGQETHEILGRFAGEAELRESEKLSFVHLMLQVKSRNVAVENLFFKIQWSVLVSVGLMISGNESDFSAIINPSDCLNDCDVLGHHVPG